MSRLEINVKINGEDKTKVLEKANEFIADGYIVKNIQDEEDGTGTVSLEQEIQEGEEYGEEKEERFDRFNSGELVD